MLKLTVILTDINIELQNMDEDYNETYPPTHLRFIAVTCLYKEFDYK